MWIVKLGGSLAQDPRLPGWLNMLAELGGGRVVVVPGGAAFADAVRASQAHWHFDDLAAHNMAVLAMAQTAHLFHALEPRLLLVSDEDEIRRALRAGQVALWMPLSLLRDAPDLLTSWEVTSDSLALWLARQQNAERLIVVKACAVQPHLTLAELTRRGTVDARFDRWASEAPFPIAVVECDAVGRVRDALLGDATLGAPMRLPPSGRQRGARVRRKPLA